MTKQVSHRSAWWSLALGVVCLLALAAGSSLLFFIQQWWILGFFCLATVIGFPAVYLGLRALLNMKYKRTSSATKFAAIGGSLFGSVFGILIGGMISGFGLLIGWIAFSTVILEGPEACLAPTREILQIDLPPESKIQPYRIRTSAMQISRIDFRNAEPVEESTVSMKVLRFPKWVTTNRQQFVGMLEDEIFDRFPRAELSARAKESLEWQMVGRTEKINRILWNWTAASEDRGKKTEVYQYWSFFDVGESSFGLVLIHQPANSNLAEDDVRNIFESFRPAKPQPKS